MAKQSGIMKLEGTIGDITFYKTKDGFMAREHAPITADRIATDPAFDRTRENMAEFGRAGKAAKTLRNAVRLLLLKAKERTTANRVTAAMVKVVKADATSTRGQRNVLDGELELIQGFECNNNARLASTLYANYTAIINRTTGSCSITVAPFIPADQLVAPEGTTHFRIVSMGAEVDFENDSFIVANSETALLPWDINSTAPVTLDNALPAASTKPLFLLLGIQFFQQVNGINYPLKNGAYNALSFVRVSGM